MKEEGNDAGMHPYVLISLLGCIVGSAFASAIVARDLQVRANYTVAGLIACGAAWALLQVLVNTTADPEVAIAYARLLGFVYLPFGPLVLLLMMQIRLIDRERQIGLLRLAWLSTLCLGVLHAITDWFVADVAARDWGWDLAMGPAFGVALVSVFAVPLGALLREVGQRDRAAVVSPVPPGVLAGVVLLPALVVVVSDILMPLFAIELPRIGSLSIVLCVGSFWIGGYRSSALSTSAFAREILDSLPDGAALLRSDGTLRAANRALSELVGVSGRDLIGRRIDRLLVQAPDLTREFADHETRLRRASGDRIPVSVSATPIRDRRGEEVGVVAVINDQREVVELRRQLVTSGQLAAVGELAAGIAHEVNNPIAFIQANLNQLHRDIDEVASQLAKHAPAQHNTRAVSEGRHFIGECRSGIDRVASIVREVRGFAHAGAGQRESADLNALVESAVRLAQAQLRGRVEVVCDYGVLPPIVCAPQDLKQVFLNLILSSARTLAGPDVIRLRTEPHDDVVEVCLDDDGRGISADALERLFDPATPGARESKEAVLGLAISYQIVRQHQGELLVESELGRGTRMTVRLPIGDRPYDEGSSGTYERSSEADSA